ncbi:unnamed protein product [Adineta ricciae]|uniref:Rho guanine nucleotide exchange factor 7 n=1 Tax=Adineta ricciae TaxID=249248 RepID=A0A813Y002_ADIRI|nr:unnamed protein product [Adineta ricciae]
MCIVYCLAFYDNDLETTEKDTNFQKRNNQTNFNRFQIMEQPNPNGKVSVTALFAFKAQNTDELSFSKNDVIVLTQTPLEGGWWEGTLDGKTGWFPSNYVEHTVKKTDSTPSTQSTSSQQCVEMQQHRETILESLLESEQHYIYELENFTTKVIQPLISSLPSWNQSVVQLDGHCFDEVVKFHHHFSHLLRDSMKTQHRIGGIFLQLAPMLKPIFENYCYQHAKVLFLLNHNKDQILNVLSKVDPYYGTNNDSYSQLIKNLSLPVHRLEKYAAFLKEYLYNLAEFHMDRGDAQRAAEYYAELATSAAEWRKRKEWELDIVHSPIHGLGSDSLASFGDALCLSPVNVLIDNNITQITFERIAILYPTALILLSTLSNQQEYQIENRFQINQITISKIVDISKRALKINVPVNQSLIISFASNTEYHDWCEKFYTLLTSKSNTSQQMLKAPSPLTGTKSAPMNTGNGPSKFPTKMPIWSKGCLRPHSPLRPNSSTVNGSHSPMPSSSVGTSDGASTNANEGGSNRTLKRFMTMKKPKTNDFLKRVETSGDDALLLSVIEAYCVTSTPNTTKTAVTNLNVLLPKTRHSVQGIVEYANLPSSSPKSADNERQTMYDMLSELRLAYKSLQQELDEEKRARKQLESQIQKLHAVSSAK